MFSLNQDLLQKEILIIPLGKCSIVISRKVGMIILGFFGIIFLYFSWIYDWGIKAKEERELIQGIEVSSTWEEYINECGSNIVLTNSFKANNIFKRKYQNNIVNWSGYFIEKKEVQASIFSERSHSLNVLIKMEPSETEFEPDIVISFSGSVHEQFKETIDSLQNGDLVNFSASFVSIGDEFNTNHLHAKSIFKTGEKKSLPEIIIIDSKLPTSLPDNMYAKPK